MVTGFSFQYKFKNQSSNTSLWEYMESWKKKLKTAPYEFLDFIVLPLNVCLWIDTNVNTNHTHPPKPSASHISCSAEPQLRKYGFPLRPWRIKTHNISTSTFISRTDTGLGFPHVGEEKTPLYQKPKIKTLKIPRQTYISK